MKVVGKRKFVAVVALPIILPSKAPTIVSATNVLVLTVFHRLVKLPLSYLSVSLGSTEVVIVCPNTSIFLPINAFLVTAIPPAVLKLPLLKFVLSATLVRIKLPSALTLPLTVNASSGAATLIPIVLLTIFKTVSGTPFLLVCKSILAPAVALYIFAAIEVDVKLNVPSTPIVRPALFLMLKFCSVVLVVSDLKNFAAATAVPATFNASAAVAVP